MKSVLLVIIFLSQSLWAQAPEEPPKELKTPTQEVMDKHHQPGGAIKVEKGNVKIEGLNSTPEEKAATEKALKEAKKKKKEIYVK